MEDGDCVFSFSGKEKLIQFPEIKVYNLSL